jgi:catechol 2,3-dioxygenase-like lactoylglutathione lyase family enzyme
MNDTFPELIATVLDAVDARKLAEFYRQLLGYVYQPGDEKPPDGEPDPKGDEWLVLRDRAETPRLAIQHVAEMPRATWPDPEVPQQLHLDMRVASADELEVQRHRVLDMGATLLEDRATDPVESLIVFADPEGHPFCILVG